ncbi:CPBP family intramembrane metalloprotease [Streptococcus iniae]|uniref:CPBP family intramembrane glutamic endopeptidase n=1 Tax=Streptococcus iniae TaxID=1346 RepID=UPI000EF6CAC7|nr:type II CAAX endopeptidase family protein [Streptococcus iniae]RLU28067.1 CPBP family intramembrane metalloprotease [Streptococcus iniae]RLU29857.1 CPBP family intramembrane metalloprotease [Streptococcus iniae]RLV32046.1 CPBP family intramembrane metalloprotease [Streptococcus iniae]
MKSIFKKNIDWINDQNGFLPIWKVLVLYILFVGLAMFMEKFGLQVTSWFNPDIPRDSQAFIDLLNTEPLSNIMMGLFSVFLLFGSFYVFGARFFGPKKDNRPIMKWVFIGIALVLALQFGDYLLNHFGPQIGLSENQQAHNEAIKNADFWRLVITLGVIPSLEEELVVRGLIQRFGFAKWPVVGIIVQALIFGNMHYATSPIHSLLYILNGGVFGYVYYKSGRLEVPMLVHFICNVLIVVYFKFLT